VVLPSEVTWWRLGDPNFVWEPVASRLDLTLTTKSEFTEDEWSRIVRARFVAGTAISLADPGGPIEATKEPMAMLRSNAKLPSREQLLAGWLWRFRR
jgi:hypothetical protein